MGQLDGKVAIVTGSGRGIGRAVALRLARDGARVVVNDLDDEPARETIALVEKQGGRAVACNGNVTAPDFGERIVDTAVREFGGVHVIVNNAGYTWDNVIQKMTDEQWYAILDVHVTAPFRVLRAFANYLRPAVEEQVRAISPRQMDRRLAPYRRQLTKRLYGRTKPGTLLKHHIPLRTDRWDVAVPGFTEIDLVAHCGSLGDGEFVHSLNLTDIYTTWVETAAVLGKSQRAVQVALEELRQALPFRLRGIDSDNGSEFINQHLWDYAQAQEIQFTRGRPYKKDDNAHVEQKNWTHIRQCFGYERHDNPEVVEPINVLVKGAYGQLLNYFHASLKLERKERTEGRLKRIYGAAQTPLARVLASPEVTPQTKRRLQQEKARLNPFALKREVDRSLKSIAANRRARP